MSKEMRSKPDHSWKWMLAITGIITIAVIILSVYAGLNPSGSGDILNSLSGNVSAEAAELLSKAEFAPPALCGFIINPQSETNYFDFVLDTGDDAVVDKEKLTPETKELINYFFLGITLPAREFWVNLNPVELNSIISPMLICTGLGKMLLETDLRLKRDAAMLTDPRLPCGKEYWDVLKAELNAKNLSNAQIPANTRLWIIPADAVIEEDKDNKDKVILVGAKLKVCLESEYDTDLSVNGNTAQSEEDKKIQDIASQAMKKVILPIIEFRVNYSKDYAQLRQIYQSLILAEYFKHKYWGKQSIYESYINTCSIGGLETKEGWSKEAMFDSYVQSMTKGEYSCIQQEYDPAQAAMIKRHYFSGGMLFSGLQTGLAQSMTPIGPGVVSSGIGGTGDFVAQTITGGNGGNRVDIKEVNLIPSELYAAQAASPIDDDGLTGFGFLYDTQWTTHTGAFSHLSTDDDGSTESGLLSETKWAIHIGIPRARIEKVQNKPLTVKEVSEEYNKIVEEYAVRAKRLTDVGIDNSSLINDMIRHLKTRITLHLRNIVTTGSFARKAVKDRSDDIVQYITILCDKIDSDKIKEHLYVVAEEVKDHPEGWSFLKNMIDSLFTKSARIVLMRKNITQHLELAEEEALKAYPEDPVVSASRIQEELDKLKEELDAPRHSIFWLEEIIDNITRRTSDPQQKQRLESLKREFIILQTERDTTYKKGKLSKVYPVRYEFIMETIHAAERNAKITVAGLYAKSLKELIAYLRTQIDSYMDSYLEQAGMAGFTNLEGEKDSIVQFITRLCTNIDSEEIKKQLNEVTASLPIGNSLLKNNRYTIKEAVNALRNKLKEQLTSVVEETERLYEKDGRGRSSSPMAIAPSKVGGIDLRKIRYRVVFNEGQPAG